MAQEALASERAEITAADAIEFYYEKGWTDGLPVVPATEDRVREFLAHAGKQPSDVIGVVPTRGRVITAEKVAINAVMAGCRPEYMPVVVAVIEAMTEPEFNYHGSLASTGGSAQLIVVNGPIARELEINGGVNVFGPGCRANATIGRAVRLIIMNVTGGIPGDLDKSTFGHGGKYSFCIAENEEASPWEPLHVQRGFRLDESAVTVFAVQSPLQFMDHASNTPEGLLDSAARAMSVMGANLGEMVVVWSPEHIGHFRNAGWTKRQAMEHLAQSAEALGGAGGERRPVVAGPDALSMIVAGGDAGGFSCIIPPWGGGRISKSVTKPVPGLNRDKERGVG
ncbi:MAG: hypothetical protein V3V35_05685 [Dehalococcoidia bacterium]